jgi:TonB-linked SusC/RagA family outer membrane protein
MYNAKPHKIMKKNQDFFKAVRKSYCILKILRIMKLTIFLLLFTVLQVFAKSTYSQQTKLTLNLGETTVEQVLKEIEDQSEFYFLFNQKLVDINRKVNLQVTDKKIDDILAQVFYGTDIDFVVIDRQIVLSPGEYLTETKIKLQPRTITGTVADENGEPLPGVSVIIQGTTRGTLSDADGQYTIEVEDQASVLVFSFVGYATQEVMVGDQTAINISMEPEVFALGDIVVIGYGTTTRQNFTGSVTTVNVEDSPEALSNTTNVMNLLRGTTTGITLTQENGEAGEEPSILVRGQKSIFGGSDDPLLRSIFGGSNDPLLVVDGVIYNGRLNDLDPNNIASLSTLKDATTLAAYGSKAANGVIMITTKKGKIGKPVIDFNSYVTLSTPGYEPQMRDGQGYIELMNYRSGLAPDADPNLWMYPLEQANYAEGKTTDWRDLIDRTGVLQNYSLSFSGATDNSNYYLSAGHLDQKGIYYGDNYSRNTFTASLSTIVNDYLDIGANANFAFNTYDGFSPSYAAAVTLSPWAEPKLANGNMRKFVDGHEPQTVHPLWDTYHGIDRGEDRKTNILGGYLNFKVPYVSGLSFKITGSYTIRSREQRNFTHETNFPDLALGDDGYTTEVFDKQLVNAEGSLTNNSRKAWVLDNILTYNKQIANHNINASLVYTRNSTQDEIYRITGSDFTGIGNTSLGVYGLSNAEVQLTDRYNYYLHNDVGYLARLIYAFRNTYHINALVRYDGSSVFGANKKWGLFPAVGGAWTISNESFMQNIGFIDNLKLKVSWGKNGNQSLSPYSTLSTVAMGLSGGNVYYLDNQAVYGQNITALGNADLGWEATASFNYGFEIDLLNRFHANVDMYKSKTTDQIFERQIPVMGSGLSTQYATMGQVDNQGIEADLTSKNIDNGVFSWSTGVFFSLNRNTLVELYGDGQDDIPNSLFIGKSLGAIYNYKWDGIVQEGEENYLSNVAATPGDAKYADLNGDGQLTADDREILGYNKENFRMSMTNTFTYKNFELYILLNGVFGGGEYGLAENNSAYLTADKFFYHNSLDHPYWTPTDPSTEYPRWDYVDWDRFVALQSYTFIRIQDVNLSYTFDKNIVNKVGVNGLKLYVACSNLYFFAPKWEGSDPEIRSFNRAQLPRSFKFGLNLQF